MFGVLLSLLPGAFGAVNNITNAISNERLKLIQAKTDQERIASEEQIATLQARRDVLVAESHSPWNGLMRFVLALGPAVILSKVLIYDKVIGSLAGCARGPMSEMLIECRTYRTDGLDANLWWVVTAVVGFYFVTGMFKK